MADSTQTKVGNSVSNVSRLGSFAVIATVVAIFWSACSKDDTQTNEPYKETGVVTKCDFAAKDLLKNPSSFSSTWDMWQKVDDGRKVTIRRNFTAMNSFGAHLDHHYECAFDYVNGRFVDLDVREGSFTMQTPPSVEKALREDKAKRQAAKESGPDISSAVAAKKLAEEYELGVPSDPKARYTVLSADQIDEEYVTVTSRRDGQAGAYFSKRLVNCRKGTYKYLAEGETLEGLATGTPDATMSNLTGESISTYIAISACQQFGL
jgi:hypothetical protein